MSAYKIGWHGRWQFIIDASTEDSARSKAEAMFVNCGAKVPASLSALLTMEGAVPLTEWAVAGNLFRAPKHRRHRLYGVAPDGKHVRTSMLAAVLGLRAARTESGSRYELVGPPTADPDAPEQDEADPLEDARACIELRTKGVA